MNAMSAAPLKMNVVRSINGVGIVLAVILGVILAIPNTPDAPPGFADTQHFFYYLLPIPVLMILSYKRVLIDPSSKCVQFTAGLLPIVFKWKIPYEDSPKVLLDAMRLKYGNSYSAEMVLPSEKKPLALLVGGDESQLREIVNFAEKAGFPMTSKKGMKQLAPAWLKPKIADLNEV